MPKQKPKLPKDFPLYAHGSGQFAKKIKGKTWFFGAWSDPDKAIRKYLDEKDEILAGRNPRLMERLPLSKVGGKLLRELVNEFLTKKRGELDRGELTGLAFKRNYSVCQFLLEQFGKDTSVESLVPNDFAVLRGKFLPTWGLKQSAEVISIIRACFKFGAESETLQKEITFGPSFKIPTESSMMRSRQEKIRLLGRLDYDADEAKTG